MERVEIDREDMALSYLRYVFTDNDHVRFTIPPLDHDIDGRFGLSEVNRCETLEHLSLHVNFAREFARAPPTQYTLDPLIRRNSVVPLKDLAAVASRRNLAFFESWKAKEEDQVLENLVYGRRAQSSDARGNSKLNWGQFSTEEQMDKHEETFSAAWRLFMGLCLRDGRIMKALFPYRMLSKQEFNCLWKVNRFFKHRDWRGIPSTPNVDWVKVNPSFYLFARFKIIDRKLNWMTYYVHDSVAVNSNDTRHLDPSEVNRIKQEKQKEDEYAQARNIWIRNPGFREIIMPVEDADRAQV